MRKNMRVVHVGVRRWKHSEETKEKIRKSNTGRKVSEFTRQKMSLIKLGNPSPLKGRKFPSTTGINHWNWKGGKENTRMLSRRYKVRKRNSLTNHHTTMEWLELKKAFKNSCLCCGEAELVVLITRDHIIPISKGGTDSIDNIQPLCLVCNIKKRDKFINFIINRKQ